MRRRIVIWGVFDSLYANVSVDTLPCSLNVKMIVILHASVDEVEDSSIEWRSVDVELLPTPLIVLDTPHRRASF